MSGLRKYSLFLLCLLSAGAANSQYYSWGGDPANIKWRQIKTPDAKLIYPADFEANARRTLWYLDTVRTGIDFGFRHGTMPTPVVLRNRNMIGNGMVMWAPKRIEMLAAPGASYSEPWLKQLIIHEYRHNVQYNNLRRGVSRPLMWLLGEQIAFLGVGQFSIYILEGDAVMAETEMSAFGRGLQPSWTMHYRAVGRDTGGGGELRRGKGRKDRQGSVVGSRDYSGDYWFSGSFRDFVPDHYRLGYQMARWSYNNFDKFIWDDVARYVSRNPQFIVPMTIGLKKQYGLTQSGLFRRTFADLNAYWDSLPIVEDSSVRVETPETSYTTYQWPMWLNDSTLVAFKRDLDRSGRIVRVDARTGREEVLANTGAVSSRPVLSPDGVVWWTEYRNSVLWDEKTDSRLCSYDTVAGEKKVHRSEEQVFFPVPLPDGTLAIVVYDYSGRFSIVQEGCRLDFPFGIEITGLAWDDVTGKLCFIGIDDGGMFLGEVGSDAEGYRRLTPSRHITISDLRAGGGRLWFGSIASGKDEAHCYDLRTGAEYLLSESAYGSFQPSPSQDGSRVAMTNYDRHGYHLAVQETAEAIEQQQRTLPLDIVNPPWKRWEMPKMDSLVYTSVQAERSGVEHKSKRYSRALGFFRPHSWLPLGFYPPAAIQEADLAMNLGATVMSQNLLSDAVSWLSYGWGRRGGSMLRGGLSYSGLGPVLDVDFTWGGSSQVLYSPVPASFSIGLKKYFSITTRLSQPMVLSSGYWFGSLTPSLEYFYTNGLIWEPYTDRPAGRLTRGVERLSFALSYSGQTRRAQKEFLPRWGIGARVGYVTNPTNNDFRSVWSASLRSWLPGVVRPHSTSAKFAWQKSVGDREAVYMFRTKEVFPRGARYDFSPWQIASASVDYQFPVWYPEGGIPSVIYFKRVRLNLFADYARWQDKKGAWRGISSYGGDIIFDISPLRMPASTAVSAVVTIAKPSDRRGMFVGFGLEMPL